MTEASQAALAILRDAGNLQWYLLPFLAFVIYVYAVEIERRNWNVVLAGLAFYGLERVLEIGNGLVLHLTGRSAIWTTPGDTVRVHDHPKMRAKITTVVALFAFDAAALVIFAGWLQWI